MFLKEGVKKGAKEFFSQKVDYVVAQLALLSGIHTYWAEYQLKAFQGVESFH